MNKKIIKVIYFFICVIIILTKECYGYLDPSAMTYIIQIVAAIGIATTTSIGILVYKIKKFFINKNKEKDKENKK